MGVGCCAPFLGGGAGSSSNTMSPGPRPTSVPSGILIHPALWPQQTWAKNGGGLWLGSKPISIPSIQPFGHNTPTSQTDRIGQTEDNGLIAYGKPFYKWSPKNGQTDRFAWWVVDLGGSKQERVQSYLPGGINVPSWEGTLAPTGEYDWTVCQRRRCGLLVPILLTATLMGNW